MGHPKGLFYLAFTEAWERFSFYGMTALLVLYMVNQLLLPGHVEHIAGFAGFRAAVESVVGPLSTQALASQIFGLYAGFVYFTPLLGGFIADRWIGQRNAVVIGALSMSAGHLAMAFDQSFLLALLLLVVGSGFLKGNISAQVGALYPREEEALRTRGFAIFSMGINFGAVAGPLLCGVLAQVYGWQYGFGIAAIFMLAGLATYLSGYRHLPARVARRARESSALTSADWRVILALIAVMIITIFQSVAYYQLANVLPVWIQQHVTLDVGALKIPVPWYQSIDALFSILGVPLLFWIWGHQAIAPSGARRSRQDRHWRLAGRSEQPDPRRRHSWRGLSARSRDLAVSLLCGAGHRFPVLLAHAAGAGLACGAGEGECDHDGACLHEPVRFEQHHRLGRRLLREDEARGILGHARRDRCDGWAAGDAVRAPAQSNVPDERGRACATACARA